MVISDHNTPEEDLPIEEKLDIIFKGNYQNYIKKIEQQAIPTKLNKKIEKNIIKAVNEIIEKLFMFLRNNQHVGNKLQFIASLFHVKR